MLPENRVIDVVGHRVTLSNEIEFQTLWSIASKIEETWEPLDAFVDDGPNSELVVNDKLLLYIDTIDANDARYDFFRWF
jgi:hypothetical protein